MYALRNFVEEELHRDSQIQSNRLTHRSWANEIDGRSCDNLHDYESGSEANMNDGFDEGSVNDDEEIEISLAICDSG